MRMDVAVVLRQLELCKCDQDGLEFVEDHPSQPRDTCISSGWASQHCYKIADAKRKPLLYKKIYLG